MIPDWQSRVWMVVATDPPDTIATRWHIAAVGRYLRDTTSAHPSWWPMTMRSARSAVIVRHAADNQTATNAETPWNSRPCRGQLPRMNR